MSRFPVFTYISLKGCKRSRGVSLVSTLYLLLYYVIIMIYFYLSLFFFFFLKEQTEQVLPCLVGFILESIECPPAEYHVFIEQRQKCDEAKKTKNKGG